MRDNIHESVQPFLQPGEELEAAFPAQTASQATIWATSGVLFVVVMALMALSGVRLGALPIALLALLAIAVVNQYRIVAATSRRILLLDAGRFSFKRARGVLGELPRTTVLASNQKGWCQITLGGATLHVRKKFFGEMDIAELYRKERLGTGHEAP